MAWRVGTALALAVGMAAAAQAADLRVGLGSMANSMDPHFRNSGPDVANMLHVFDKLILQDERQQIVPGLARSWTRIDEMTWEIELRDGVTFHDGTPFTADDVVFTLQRAVNVPNSSSPFATYIRTIASATADGPLKVRLRTAYPAPLLPVDLSTFGIISRRHGEGAEINEYNSGKAAIGTGPFKLKEFVPNSRIAYVRNDAYWGPKPVWDSVTFRLIPNPSARSAALLAGDVDLIEQVPADAVKALERADGVSVEKALSNRVIYLILDSHSDTSPNLRDNAGQPLPTNPLKDVRVRKAISLAMNRQALVDRLLDGQGVPTGQIVPPGFFGHDPAMPVAAHDPDQGRRLLAEAGYPNGFQMTIHGSNGRYLNDVQQIQTIGQFLTRIGIQPTVEALPRQVFATRGNKFEFALGFYGWGTDTGEAASTLRALLLTRDGKGDGASNRGRYSNPALDALIKKALTIFDDKEREKALQHATRVAMEDVGIVPLYFQVNVWAARKGFGYTARADEFTLAMSAVAK